MKGTNRPKWGEIAIPRYIEGPILDIGCSYKSRKKDFDSYYISLDIDKQTHPTIIGDSTNLPIKNNCITNILCLSVLEHVKNPTKAIEESYNCLNKNGTIYISVPFMYFRHDWCDYQRYTIEGITELLQKFKIISTEKQYSGLFTTITSWIIPTTYNLPKTLRIPIQWTLHIILKITQKIDIGKNRFYNSTYTIAEKS